MMTNPTPVFIVDQNDLFVKLLEYVFTKDTAYQFREFRNIEDCLHHLDHDPAVIVIDRDLPGMDGSNTIRLIRSKCPNAHIITLLDVNYTNKAQLMMTEGADAFVTKDINKIANLIKALEHHFAHRKEIKDDVVPRRRALPILKALCVFIIVVVLVSAGIYYLGGDETI